MYFHTYLDMILAYLSQFGLKNGRMEDPKPSRGPGSKRLRKRGHKSRFIHSTAWNLEKTIGWHGIIDFLGTFYSHLQVNRSLFKSFVWDVIGGDREEEWMTLVDGGDPLRQNPEDGNHQKMQRALDVIPESMLEKLVDESRELVSSGHCSAHQDIAASSGDCSTRSDRTQDWQEAVYPDHDEAV